MAMTEETFAAFNRIKTHVQANDGIDSNDDLILIGKALGNSEEEMKMEFPELYETEEDSEEEDDLDTDPLDDDTEKEEEDESAT